MPWVYLFLAGLFEIVWVVAMKYAQGFTKPMPSIVMIVGMIISFGFLAMAVKHLPLGTSYAIWTGIGAIGAMIAGIVLFGESASAFRIGSACLIIAGIIGLKLSAV
jgi:quaternary ammonium compound-resistance protein SugE